MYAMAIDNSWEIMNEEEMYEVNGGFYTTPVYSHGSFTFKIPFGPTISIPFSWRSGTRLHIEWSDINTICSLLSYGLYEGAAATAYFGPWWPVISLAGAVIFTLADIATSNKSGVAFSFKVPF